MAILHSSSRAISAMDVIIDFKAGVGAGDVLELDHSQFANISDAFNHANDDGHGNTVIQLDASHTILLMMS